jgi:FixJ family two-component response regulator
LIAAVRAALAQDRKLRQRKAELAKLQERYSLLTPREREVLPLVIGGLLNKQAASVLGISEVTLQIHRSQVMRKMQAESFAELVRMAVKLRIPYWRGWRTWR